MHMRIQDFVRGGANFPKFIDKPGASKYNKEKHIAKFSKKEEQPILQDGRLYASVRRQ